VETTLETRWNAFISYSRADSVFVKHLVTELKAGGMTAWVDIHDIPPAEMWREELRRAITSADNFIFVMSPDSLTSEECRKELQFAFELHKRLIPLLWRSVERQELPEDSPLRGPQWIDMTGYAPDMPSGEFTHIERLIAVLRNEYHWRRQSTDYLVRAEAQERAEGPPLHRSELEAAREWLKVGAAMVPGPTEQQIKYIQASEAHHLEVAERWKSLYNKTKARRLAAEARVRIGQMPDLALLLAAEAQTLEDLVETRRTLLHCLDVHRPLLCTFHELNAGKVTAIALSPDGRRLAATDNDKLVVWNLDSFDLFRKIEAKFNALTFGVDADELIVAVESTIKIAGIRPGELTGREFLGHNAFVRALACDPVRSRLASGDDGGRILVWDLNVYTPS
jgi:hypothetical protein